MVSYRRGIEGGASAAFVIEGGMYQIRGRSMVGMFLVKRRVVKQDDG